MMSSDERTEVHGGMRRLPDADLDTLPADGGERFNRLIFAASPYLLQHAENPVDWYEWGEEAFRVAAETDRPIFLSIGYATCHWCHVMEAESFENRAVAQVLNRHFVAIKVDREERPDIDARYMAVAQMITGSGGWPLTIVMTPDRRPFFAATYIPVTPRMGMPGIIQLLERIADLWRSERQMLERSCATVMEALSLEAAVVSADLPGNDILRQAEEQLTAIFDRLNCGFGSAPKFPMPLNLLFLLLCRKRHNRSDSLAMVEQTLRRMRAGGIWDQLGSGIHRYAVDSAWQVPHFEKMLYDQALLASVSIETFRATGDDFYRRMAEDLLAFVLRDMTAPEGGFYAGLDADTEGEEGRCYLWTTAEISDVLGDADGAAACDLFGVTERGNFEGRNILHLAADAELPPAGEMWRERLLAARGRRVQPFRDEKIVAAWNGLTIAALAAVHAATGNDRWRTAAERAVNFLRGNLVTTDGRIRRSLHRGKGSVPGFLDDYAFLVHGLLELYNATLETRHLEEARHFAGEMLRLFRDPASGGLWDSGIDTEEILLRRTDANDGVIPSGASVAALALVRLGRITGETSYTEAATAVLRVNLGGERRHPLGLLLSLMAADILATDPVTITLSAPAGKPADRAMLRVVGSRYLPDAVVVRRDGDIAAEVCGAGVCRLPVGTAEELARELDDVCGKSG